MNILTHSLVWVILTGLREHVREDVLDQLNIYLLLRLVLWVADLLTFILLILCPFFCKHSAHFSLPTPHPLPLHSPPPILQLPVLETCIRNNHHDAVIDSIFNMIGQFYSDRLTNKAEQFEIRQFSCKEKEVFRLNTMAMSFFNEQKPFYDSLL